MKILIKNISQIIGCNARDNYMPLYGNDTREPIIPGNSILIENGKIKSIGINIQDRADKIIDAKDCIVTPGYVESHSHLIFAGTREDEFEKRIMGMSYKQIAEQGGGILNTVKATRKASLEQLFLNAKKYLLELIKSGITSIEIKSGYGLDFETEIKQLEVIKLLKENFNINIKATFLGAHEIPLEYRDNRKKYIEILKNEMIPYIAEKKLADYIDVFCERGVYTEKESMEIIETGLRYGLIPRIHADEIETSGGSSVAAKLKAASVDHMNVPRKNDLSILAKHKTIITLLPATNFILRINKKPPIEEMRKNHNIIAISTDFNPGSSPVLSMNLTAAIAMYLYALLPKEIMYAITINPAYSLNIDKNTGSIAIDKDADIIIHNIDNYKKIFYYFGYNTVKMVLAKGEILYGN